MSISFSCPSCDHALKVRDELAGRKVKCPSCANVVVVPADEEEEEPEEEERPRKKKKKKRKKQSSTALIVGILAGVLLLAGGGVAIVLAVTSGKKEEPQVKAPPAAPAGNNDAKPQFQPKEKKGKGLISAVARRLEATEVNNWFRQLGLSYKAVEAGNGKGPASFAELTELARSPLKEWLDKGWIVVVWGVRYSNLPNGSSNTALAWETDADGQGLRIVLMCDGSIQTVDEATFARTAKAMGGR